MKKKVLCAFSLILYLLIVCTLLSEKIEVEMRTQVETHEIKGNSIYSFLELPASYLFQQDGKSTLFEVTENTGWESGLKAQAIPDEAWSLNTVSESDKVAISLGSQCTFIRTASRTPQSGELVDIIKTTDTHSDTWLVLYPEGVPAYDALPAGIQVISKTENALLLSVEESKYPFFEHRALMELQQIAKEDMRVYSLSTVSEFINQIPDLCSVLLLLLAPVFIWIFSCFLSVHANRHKLLLVVNILFAMISLFLLRLVLNEIDLPAAILPGDNILNLQHYRNVFSAITSASKEFPVEVQHLIAANVLLDTRWLDALRRCILVSAALILAEGIIFWVEEQHTRKKLKVN